MTRVRAWLVLVLLLGLVAIYAVLWANWSWVYTHDRYVQLEPGKSSVASQMGFELRLVSISRAEPGSYEVYGDFPDGSAIIEVLAEARLAGEPPDIGTLCQGPLVAAEREWKPASGSFEDDRATDCAAEGPLDDQWREFTLAYVVPERYVDQIHGVVVYHYDGTPGEVLRP